MWVGIGRERVEERRDEKRVGVWSGGEGGEGEGGEEGTLVMWVICSGEGRQIDGGREGEKDVGFIGRSTR